MVRKSPCQYCKRRRRKCERDNESEPCARCRRMGKKCIPQDFETTSSASSDDFDFTSDGINEEQYEFMQQQVEMLEKEIKQLEIGITDQKALTRKEPQWDITVTNGEVRLHSEIKTLQEFMLFRQSALRYLSPFSGTFYRNSLVFERIEPSLVKKVVNIATRLQHVSRNPFGQLSKSLISPYNHMHETTQFTHSTALVDVLVNSFFRCVNVLFPLVHEATFRHYYQNSKKDPLKEPLIAAMCCSAAISTCEHSLFNPLEKRFISEYFYDIAINLLIDIFDDPNHALEALVSINLLYKFMGLTLRINEARKWSSIANVIGDNLKKEMEPYQEVKNEYPNLRIKSAITQRNSIMAEATMAIIEFVAFNREESIKPKNITLDILPDEHGVTRDFLEAVNYILDLLRNPIIVKILSQARRLVVGQDVEFSFDELMRFEEILNEWWHKIPDDVKLTKEPLDCTKDIIKNCTEIKKLAMCGYVHVLTLSLQSCLINPKFKEPTENISNIVRERAISLVIYSAEIALTASKQVASLPGLCLSPMAHLLRVLDSIIMIIHSQDEKVASTARSMLQKCMAEINETISRDHRISSFISPVHADDHASDSVTAPETDLYFKYPIPGAALVYDVLQNSVGKL